MIASLSKEVSAALHAAGQQGVEFIDPETQRHYVLVERDMHQRAMEALRRQHDCDAIADGIAQMEADQGKPLEQVFADIHSP